MNKELQKKQQPKSGVLYYLSKMKGAQRVPTRTTLPDAVIGGLGGFLSASTLLLLTHLTDTMWLMASLGGSCLLVFVLWSAPLSQPRNLVGGHVISAAIGLIIYHFMGATPFSVALALSLAIFFMSIIGCIHPPACANPIIIILEGYTWSYLITPVLLGAILLVVYAMIINNLHKNRYYPVFW